MFTVDEGDHFVGGSPTPSSCDGVNIPCDWTGQVGELNANIDTLVTHQFPALASQFLGGGAAYAFTVHGDDAPPFYLAKKGAGGGPLSQTDPLTRQFERAMVDLTAVNSYTGLTDHLLVQMGDQTEMKALHMFTTGDPARNATFVLFADPDYFITDFPSSTCETCINPAFAWNHGDIQPEIAHTWLGFAGPGVQNLRTASPWTDHTDVRPTMWALLGLADPYESDGRVVTEVLDTKSYSQALTAPGNRGAARGDLQAAERALRRLRDEDPGRVDAGARRRCATYAAIEAAIASPTSQRDALAAQIRTTLNTAAFGGMPLDEQQAKSWIDQAQSLLDQACALASS